MSAAELLKSFRLLRSSLLNQLFARFPSCKGEQFLFSLPKSGEIIVEDATWIFRKHGGE